MHANVRVPKFSPFIRFCYCCSVCFFSRSYDPHRVHLLVIGKTPTRSDYHMCVFQVNKSPGGIIFHAAVSCVGEDYTHSVPNYNYTRVSPFRRTWCDSSHSANRSLNARKYLDNKSTKSLSICSSNNIRCVPIIDANSATLASTLCYIKPAHIPPPPFACRAHLAIHNISHTSLRNRPAERPTNRNCAAVRVLVVYFRFAVITKLQSFYHLISSLVPNTHTNSTYRIASAH